MPLEVLDVEEVPEFGLAGLVFDAGVGLLGGGFVVLHLASLAISSDG